MRFNFIFTFLLVIIFTFYCKAEWEKCNSPKYGSFNEIVKYGDIYLGATNDGTAISTDGGKNWELQSNILKGRKVFRILTSDSIVYYLSDGPFCVSSDVGKNLQTLNNNNLNNSIDPNFNYCNNKDTIFYKNGKFLYIYYNNFTTNIQFFAKYMNIETKQLYKFQNGVLIKTNNGYYKTNGFKQSADYVDELNSFPNFKFFAFNDSLVYFADDTSLYVSDTKFSYYRKIDSLTSYYDKYIDLVMTDIGLVVSTQLSGIYKFDSFQQKELLEFSKYKQDGNFKIFYFQNELFLTDSYTNIKLDYRNYHFNLFGYTEYGLSKPSKIRNEKIWGEFGGILHYSDDYGLNWKIIDSKIRETKSFEVIDSIILVTTIESEPDFETQLYKTTNFGLTWDSIFTEDYMFSYEMLYIGENLYAIEDYGILLSKDTGMTWKNIAYVTYPYCLVKIGDYLFANGGYEIIRMRLDDYEQKLRKDVFWYEIKIVVQINDKIIIYPKYQSLPWYYISNDYGTNLTNVNEQLKISELIVYDNNDIKYDLINSTLMFTFDSGITWINPYLEFEKIDEIIIMKDYIIIRKEDGIFRKKLLEFSTTNVIENNNNKNITISPNPAKDFLTINLNPSEGLKPSEGSVVEIYNSFGELVLIDVPHLQDVAHLKRIDISQLPAGLYFVKIGDRVEKFVKI